MKKLICIILAVLMLFTLMACKNEQEQEEEPEIDTMPKFNTTDMVEFIGWGDEKINGIKLNSDREDVVFECVIDEGKLSLDDEEAKELTAKPDDIIYYIAAKNLDFVEIRMKSGEQLLGYALIEIYGFPFQPILLESEISYEQGFTEEYVNETIDYTKNYFPELTERQKKQIKEIDNEIIQARLMYDEDALIFYGEYNRALVLFFPHLSPDYENNNMQKIAGLKFCKYGRYNVWTIFVLKDGKAFNLSFSKDEKVVFNDGILTQRDVEIIASIHAKYCNNKY